MEDFIRISDFIKTFDEDEPHGLWGLRKNAVAADVPIIRQEMENFLRVQLMMLKPRRILELGTAVGYSSIFMALNSDAEIDTIENYEPRIREAKENFEKYKLSDRIHLYEGDCLEILKDLSGEYDMIFMDAAKGQYMSYLPQCLRLLRIGGIMITDNILSDLEILKSRYVIDRRDRTIHTRMREYLYEITHCDGLLTTLIPLGDGVSLSVRKED